VTRQSLDVFKEILPSIFRKTRTVIDEESSDKSDSLFPTRAITTILSRSSATLDVAVALAEMKHLPASAAYELAREFAPTRQPKFTFKNKKAEKTRVDEIIAVLGVDQPTAELYDSILSDDEIEYIKSNKYQGGIDG
jgi:hypothetical protein